MVPPLELDGPATAPPPAPATSERRAAPRIPVDHLGIVLQIEGRRRLRRPWRRPVSASVAILDIAEPQGRPLRLVGRDLRTGFIVVMDARRTSGRVTVVGLRPPGAAKARRVRWRFRVGASALLPASAHLALRYGAPLPGHGLWALPQCGGQAVQHMRGQRLATTARAPPCKNAWARLITPSPRTSCPAAPLQAESTTTLSRSGSLTISRACNRPSSARSPAASTTAERSGCCGSTTACVAKCSSP